MRAGILLALVFLTTSCGAQTNHARVPPPSDRGVIKFGASFSPNFRIIGQTKVFSTRQPIFLGCLPSPKVGDAAIDSCLHKTGNRQ